MADGARAERLGEIIRRQRELSELSMRQFADLAGISNPYLSQIERGLREPSERVLDAIASTLQVSADTLYEQAGVTVGEEPETGVLEAAGFEGVAVPDDLSVVVFDDIEVAPYVGLTTVHQPLEDSGRRGVERLVAALRNEDSQPREERLELVLKTRRTTAPPP